MKKIYLWLFLFVLSNQAFTQNYTVLGNASSLGGCNCFRLTPDANDQAGAIFQNQTIDLNNSFDFTFNAFLGCRNGNDAADGIVFVLTNNPQGLGSGGGGLGYGGSNQPFSLGVEFDTYQNSQDPSYDHIAIEAGGTVDHNVAGPVPALANSANIDNCQNYLVRIVWDVNTNTYSVYFDGVLRISQVIPNMVNTYFGGNPIVNWGWTAGTGGGTNDQQICVLNTSNWVGGVNYQSCSTTFNFQDISTSSLGSIASWAWNFGDGATSTSQNPSHTYAANGTYTVTLTITDQSGCTNTYSHPVTINAPITIAPTINQPPCNGGSNGGITTVVGGGFGPSAGYGGYTYHWSNNTVGSSLVGASAGTYTLTVTDGVCTTTGTYTVNQPTALTATTSHTDANCNLPNGTATITISGGTPPYNGVNWGPLPNMQGNTATGLGPGHYIADFHDANNCSALLQYAETIGSLPCGITSSTSVTNVLCRGASTGSATLTVTGSTGTPTITWNPGGFTGATISNKPAGTYTYTYTDANPAHNFNGSVTITEPPATMAVSVATVNMSCSASNDGQALASITAGGVSPFNYNWNPAGANAPVRSNLSAGAVSVTVTDANSCTASATGTITGPPTLTLNITKVDDSCYHSRTGSALANVSGGNPPYTFNWSNISSAQNNLSLGAGTYTVTVTDDKGCTITGSTTLSEPTPFTHTPLVPTNINCFGATTGAISTSAAGGTPGYNYSWNPATATGNNPTGLAAGQYNLTLTDAHNCTILDSVVLTQPASALTVTTSHTNVSCNGGNTGTLTITVGGGTPPYSFLGNPVPAGTTVIPGRTAGTYAGNLTDANGCSVAVSETITEPAVLALGEQHTNILCNGASTGAIDVTVGGGTTPYTFVWNGGSPTTEDRTAIPAGTYSVTVTDFNSCTATISATLTQPAALTISQTHVDVLCNGASTGSIDVTVGGGVAAYTYAWSDGPVTTEDRTAIPAGTYTVTATDQNVCTISVSATIAQPTALSVTTSHTDVKCHGGADGTLTITVGGGTPPYSFLGNPVPAGTTVVPGRTAGTYAGNLTDANGCTFAVSETIAEPGVQSLTVSNTNEPCFGATVATASANFVNATGTVTYNWTGGLSGTPLNNLSAGTYDVTATDQNLCSVTGTVTVTQPAAPVMNVNVTNATCFGANGSATALPTGGTAPYSYTWSGGGSGATVAKPAGSYTVTATDASTCQQTASFVITQPIGMTVTKAHTNLLCFGDANGTITLTTTGGAGGPYTYAWSANANTGNSNAATQLTAGIYSATITDVNNCTTSISDTLTQPSLPVTITIDQHVITCYGANNGSISISTTGGTGPYTYNWNPNVTTDSAATNLGPANYGITITDANGCSLNTQINITEPSQPLNLTASQTNLTCFQSNDGTASVIANGGTAPYSFAWTPNVSSSFSASALAAGNYTLTVTDNNGCTEDTFFLITQPAQLTASGTPLNVLCNGNATGAVTITANGGTPAYSYVWSPNVSSADTVSGLTAGTYLVTVTDTHNCSVSVSTTVTEPALLTLSSTTTPATCYGAATGTITVIPAGGAGNYAFSATDGAAVYNSANGQFGNLSAGTYALAVTDQNSCSATGSATISQPDTLQAPFYVFPATCYHYTDGRIEVAPIGGAGGYNFSLSNGDANPTGNFGGLGAGTYSFTVTDVNGCTANGNGAITEPDSVGLTVSPNPVEVDLGNSLQITTTTTQTGTITYDWSPKFGLSCYDCADPVFNGVYSQPYTVVMTTDAGCKGIAQLVVTVIPKYDVFIPNVFTPNGDGANDFWQIFGNLPAFKQLQVMVFNRIGEKVFESNDINFKWDGTFKGQSAPPGVYSYVAKFVWLNNHSDSDYKGTITLLR
jgi:gliding motility-associated-like protein